MYSEVSSSFPFFRDDIVIVIADTGLGSVTGVIVAGYLHVPPCSIRVREMQVAGNSASAVALYGYNIEVGDKFE